MNQPTREEFEELKAGQRRLEEEIRQLRERQTEEIKAVRVNVASQDVIDRLDKLEKDLNTHSETWLNTLQEHYTEHKEAITDVKTVQSGHSKFFEEHGKRLAATATKDDISAMAAKEDMVAMENRIIETIKQLLQQKSDE